MLVAAVVAAVAGATAQAAPFTVCATCTYTTIQDAINAADPGDTISVADGTYTENLTINKALTLDGQSRAGTIIDAGAGESVYVVVVTADDVTLQDLHLQVRPAVAQQRGLHIPNGSTVQNLTLDNVNITGAVNRYGIQVSGVALDLSVINSFFSNNATGILIADDGLIDGLTLTGSAFDHGPDTTTQEVGLYVSNDSQLGNDQGILRNATISGNTFTGLRPSGHPGIGLYIEEAQTVLIEDNTFTGNHRGIQIYKALSPARVLSNVTIRGNNFVDQTNAGIRLQNYTSVNVVSIEDNTFTGNLRGISLHGDGTGWNTTHASGNSFMGSGSGVEVTVHGEPGDNLDGTSFNATNNWWGNAAGPGNLTNITTTPWYTNSGFTMQSDNANLTALSLSSGTLSPAFSSSTTSYSASVGNDVTAVTVSQTAVAGANAVVNGGSSLAVGNNTVTVTVTSADSSATKTYTITVNRAAAPPAPTPAPTPAPPVDVCPNLGDDQAEVPNGFDLVNGQCVPKPPVVNARVSAPAAPDQPGTVTVVVAPTTPAPGTTTPAPPVTVAVSWPAGTFATPVTVLVTPQVAAPVPAGTALAPPVVPGGFTVGTTTVTVTVTDSSGAAVHQFAAPLVIHVSASEASDVPAYSQDRVIWVPIPQLGSPELPAGQPDGYYRNADGSIDIYTRHATLFGLLKDTQAPSAPTLKPTIKGNKLYLLLQGAKDNVRVASYRVLFNGRRLKATTRSYVVVPARPGRFQATAVDAAGNTSKRSAVFTITKPAAAAAPVRSTPATGTLKTHVSPVIGVRDGLLHVTLTGLPAQAVLVRIGGGLASGGKWFGWVPLKRTGPSSWSSDLRAPGFLGVYPLQVRAGSKIVEAGPLVRILPRGFDRQPAFSTPEEVADWWARTSRASGRLIGASEWHTGFFTHRDARFNRLLRVTVALPGSGTETMFLSAARLRADGPWRLLEAVVAP